MRYVELHDLLAAARTDVSHAHVPFDVLSRTDLVRTQLEIIVAPARIAESIPEREIRLARDIAVGPPGHRVIVERWQVPDRAVECDWQATRWIVDSRERLRNGASTLLSRIPRDEDRLRLRSHLRIQRDRTARLQNDDQRSPGSGEGDQQLSLRRWEV